jgi:exopolysaccharide production protein ExoY
MTGAWAVSGRSAVGYPARAHLELDYVASWSLWLDLRLLWRTIPRVLGAHGAH